MSELILDYQAYWPRNPQKNQPMRRSVPPQKPPMTASSPALLTDSEAEVMKEEISNLKEELSRLQDQINQQAKEHSRQRSPQKPPVGDHAIFSFPLCSSMSCTAFLRQLPFLG